MTQREDELTNWIKSTDADSLSERVERLHFVRDQCDRDHGSLFWGGLISAQAFQEMQFCYIHGAYISCVLAAQVVLEHELGALLKWKERNDLDSVGFARLCDAALSEELISQDEFDRFNSVRRLRNPYTHGTPFMGQSCITRRSAETRAPPEELFKADAELALTAVIRMTSRPPFAVG